MTTENSRADALTDEQLLEIARKACPPFPWGIGSTWADFLTAVRAILAASSVEQPAAAPTDIEARFIAEHGHRLAQLLRIDAFDIADRDAQIMATLRSESTTSGGMGR